MRAIQVREYVKGPLDLTVTTLPTPTPSADKYLIEIHSAGTNFFDLLQIQGKYQHQPPVPWISGMEFGGTILSPPTAASSPKFKVGDRVFGASQVAYATHILAHESALRPVPEGWSFEDAAGLFITAPTSYGGLVTRANVRGGPSCGTDCKGQGGNRYRDTGSDRKRQIAKSFGADYTIEYKDSKWPDAVKKLCAEKRTGNGKAGVDIVYDPVGMIDQSLKCVAWNARLLVIGFAAGKIEEVALNRVLLKNVSIMGLHWGQYVNFEKDTVGVVWDGIFELIRQRKFRGTSFTDQSFVGLESIPKALQALGGPETCGKVVVKIPDESEGTSSKL
ncbi:alcohol dehydrogenase [Histoplasma capsulatum var. duboisii H88]|uniref:Alcohol dehydrogenase n=1 Tax=Ajellomyces capsulatus (strain H88) TaxID=544711 RepID=F0UJR5_AJEC8|nr:alcohol dehydrogenase [Histoplasma capsulatum var. duboisii H88]